jgi:hypothetical protein
MQYEEALIIGKRRRADAAAALSAYVKERVTDICAVKPAKDAGIDARDWEPVGEENFKEILIQTECDGNKVGTLLVVDRDNTAKAATLKRYPLPIALQMAAAFPLPVYVGRGGTLFQELQDEAMRKAQSIIQLPEL